nr:nucleotide-binding alpha-beta plait domain-containing protein [Tanacetum cinerariifolium]
MFGRYGRVVDVYIAFKKTKRDTRFGFVRFTNIGDINSFERRLKYILTRNERMVINHAKFAKGSYNYAPPADFPSINPDACVKPKQQHHHPENIPHSGRLTWLVIEGLLIIVRNISFDKTIIKGFGKLVKIGKLDFDSKLPFPVKCLVFMSNMLEDSMFEEEFIGSSIANGDGLAPSDDICSKPGEDDKFQAVYSLIPSRRGGSSIVDVRPTVKNIILGLSPIPYGHHPPKDSELAHSATSNEPASCVVEHVPDLNAHPGVAVDQELDELLSSFQWIFDMANEPHPAGGKKNITKHKKIKLSVGDTSCPHVLVSQNKDVTLDDDTQMKLIEEQPGYSFINSGTEREAEKSL